MEFQYDPAFRINDLLAHELLELAKEGLEARPLPTEEHSGVARGEVELPLRNADAIVAHIEVNNRHGVGVLLERLFGRYPNILSIRSENHFGGQQSFGDLDLLIAHEGAGRDRVLRNVSEALGENTVGRILCVPYFADDVRTALALREISGAPLVTYLMDDQNICAKGIPDALMGELLEKSVLRLAISTELAVAYEARYRHRFWLMPPVIPARHILAEPVPLDECLAEPNTGAILGNIWGQRWLDLLRATVRGTGLKLVWYSTNHLRYLQGSPEELAADGIEIPPGPPLADPDLVDALRQTAFVVVPTGTLEEDDDRRFIAQLSLPSRIPFIMATSHAPFLVVGSEETGAARFTRELGVGIVTPYGTEAFRAAVEEITRPEVNEGMRRRALALAARFTDAGAAEWIWQSLERGEAFDSRYEDLMRRPRPDVEELVKQKEQSS